MASTEYKLSLSYAWWLKPYLLVLVFCCILAHRVPDQERLAAVIKRAARVSVE